MKTSVLLASLRRKLRGHYNYFGVIGNLAGLHAVKQHVMELLYKWLNRRSGRRSFTWERLKHYLIFNPLHYLCAEQRQRQRRFGGRVDEVFADCESEYNRGAP